jgi:hypothetical protein
MNYQAEILKLAGNAEAMEALYQAALATGEGQLFASEMYACFQEAPDDLLLAAWYYRLQAAPVPPAPTHPERSLVWRWAVPFALASGLLLGLLAMFSEDANRVPLFVLAWAPIAATLAIAFLALAGRRPVAYPILAVAVLAAALLYVLGISSSLPTWLSDAYQDQMVIHLPLLSWIALGFALLGLRSTIKDRFSFLVKSIEAAITAGLYLIAGVAFGAITIGMLSALSIELPEKAILFLVGGGIGLISIIALATIYDPRLSPGEQDFTQGLSKFIANMMRLLLPLTLLVLGIYALIIPFNFEQPFQNRDVLIVYNVMLFAIIGLLLGATPLRAEDLSPKLKSALRVGILAVALLAILVSMYALSAILYRTLTDQLTLNRLVIIGWNLINTAILAILAYQLLRHRDDSWVGKAQGVFSRATLAYTVWTLFVIFAIPLIF